MQGLFVGSMGCAEVICRKYGVCRGYLEEAWGVQGLFVGSMRCAGVICRKYGLCRGYL